MRYNVSILNKPFVKNDVFCLDDKDIIIKTQKTARITFLNNDGSNEYTKEYGYISPDEISTIVAARQKLNLNSCFVSNYCFNFQSLLDFEAKGALFGDEVSFKDTFFNALAVFESSIFDKAIFKGAHFKGAASFKGATFNTASNFSYAKFDNDADFSKTVFKDETNFSRAEFCDHSNFTDTTFFRANFSFSVFNCSTYFKGTTFFGETDFSVAKIDKADFLRASFNENANFSEVEFSGDINFDAATFSGVADFYKAIFYSRVSFQEATFIKASYPAALFKREADFLNVIVEDFIQFDSVMFLSYASFDFQRCYELCFDNCVFERYCTISSYMGFGTLVIHDCKTTVPISIVFDDNLKKAILHQLCTLTTVSNQHYESVAQQFNFLKANCNRNGEYDEEDQAYVEYRRCLRKTKKPISGAFEWLFLDKISCYCTRPFKVFRWAVITIACFAGLYFIPGVVSFQAANQTALDITFLQQLWNRLYHSIITFFTIGYGDTTPTGWIGLFLTGLEGFVGVFLMSLFTVSFVRKVLR